MSVQYIAVTWNRQKRIYDLIVALSVLFLVGIFFVASLVTHPTITFETGLIRGLGLTALLLLHIILCIGPLCRLNPAFLPLLYNRRHLGVTMAIVAFGHAGFAVVQFHAFGDVNPLVSVLSSNGDVGSLAGFPFELLGLAALLILLLMAATSHDFWLSILSPPVWKALHMLVYLAYALLIGHVALGSMQAETSAVLPTVLGAGAVVVIGLHIAAGLREWRLDREKERGGEWTPVCRADAIPEKRAKVAMVGGERVAVFRFDGKLSCVSNVCRHQNGPLGEGRIVDGCITCPWHGYQYRPDSGTSPPPYDDQVATYELRVEDGVVLVNARSNTPGTRVEPIEVPPPRPISAGHDGPFYIGYAPTTDPALARHTRAALAGIAVLSSGAMLALALAQPPFAAASFEFGHPRTVSGRVVSGAYPALEVTDGNRIRRYLLAAAGKHGAGPMTAPHEGRNVALVGTLIHRGNAAMLEIASISAADDTTARPARQQVDFGRYTLTGEIVDAKCWLGVMNPGEGKTHLGCAVRCLSGGLPPLLVIRDSTGAEQHLILTDERGAPMPKSVLPDVGRPVRVAGRVVREGDLLFIEAAREAVERIR